MKRWCLSRGREIEDPIVDAFLADIIEVCKKHNLWLSHEDGHGAFIVTNINTEDWLNAAVVEKINSITKMKKITQASTGQP